MAVEVLIRRVDRLERHQERLETDQESLKERLSQMERVQAVAGAEISTIKEDIQDIKEGQRWNNRYTIGALVTALMTLLTIWATVGR
ncbi:MAG: hemolysin XhlA family protein [Bacillota bacterium]|nr:hemolysin XhlA family protein [Bacillota bacterium]